MPPALAFKSSYQRRECCRTKHLTLKLFRLGSVGNYGCRRRRGCGWNDWLPKVRPRLDDTRSICSTLVKLAENHLARCRLQHRSNGNFDVPADHLSRIVHNHHGPVVEIGDTLVVLLTYFQDEDLHDFAGQHDRLK